MAPDLVCKKCGKPIYCKYIFALGFTRHPEHFICDIWGKPIQGITFYKKDKSNCFQSKLASRCEYWGAILARKYMVDYWGTKFCPKYVNELPGCVFCNRLICLQNNQKNEIGFYRCKMYQSDAMESIENAYSILGEIIKWFKRKRLEFTETKFKINLIKLSELGHSQIDVTNLHILGTTNYSTYFIEKNIN